MKVVIGGGSGLIGAALVRSLERDGNEVVVVSREAGPGEVAWEDVGREVDGADAVVNLAGVSIGGPRWTAGRKEAIRASRIETTRTLARAIDAAERRPDVFVTASGIDIYGDTGDILVDESSPPGSTFLARVCTEWEDAAADVPVRHVAVRTSLVVAPGAKAVSLMALPFRFFVGGPLGNGRQWFPWIALDDLVAVYRRALEDDALRGPVNAVAPGILRQSEAAKVFGAVLGRPSVLPAPAPLLRLALGEQADLLLHGQRAASGKLGDLVFEQPDLRSALEDALRQSSS